MIALAYGITRAGEHGWSDAVTVTAFGFAALLMIVFLWLQARREPPMLPLGLFRAIAIGRDPTRPCGSSAAG
ncbi:hypothetical protein [Alienimonas californiensis]|uniref:hypothetical protein n=1 Tax=Alienimonas californiensis TaxID=2527989 RepID=UPI001A9845AA|nr:hypothetical protein [Alienimonas californiensis]